MTVEFLKMIGHGTTGSDGIEPGIHLRWAFHYKLGFPPCFRLFRRDSRPENLHYLAIDNGMNFDLPYSQGSAGSNFRFLLESAIIADRSVTSISSEALNLPDGRQVDVLALDGELVFSFSEPVSRVELELVISPQSAYRITARAPTGDYDPQPILGTATGLQQLAFDAPGTTGLIFRGTGIALAALRVWICGQEGPWTEIKEKCGCGLPINQERTDYTADAYPAFMDNDLVAGLCRLDALTLQETEFTLEDFLNLKIMLLSMLPEGILVPWGWTQFPATPNDITEEESDNQLEYSKYDFLLAQSQHVFYAKILDLYFVDKGADADTYYDYKVTATWPESNLRQLEHEITFEDYEIGHIFYRVCVLDENGVLLANSTPQIVAESYANARTEQGLLITTGVGFTIVNFVNPVTEVQIALVNRSFDAGQNELTVEAYRNYLSKYVDRQTLTAERGLVRVRAEKIDSLRIYGSNFVISRLSYDFDLYPEGLQEAIICGLKRQNHYPLEMPTGLSATLVPGGSVNDSDGNVTEKPYVVGLRWNANEDPDAALLSIAPVLYDIQRKAPDGQQDWLTENAPVFIAPSAVDEATRTVPYGWPEERQYYLDSLSEKLNYSYRIAAQDLFGRKSRYTNFVTYRAQQTRPPHPIDVTAQFLDYSTYDSATDTFSDVTLSAGDRNWLRANRKNAIVVRWKWSANLQLQAPDVDGFNVFYKQGWLNSYSGEITHDYAESTLTLVLTREEAAKYAIFGTSPVTVPVFKIKTALTLGEAVAADTFRLCWLSQGANRFLALKNSAGTKPEIWVLDQSPIVTYKPEKNRGFGIAVTAENEHFIDYLDPENWQDQSISHHERKDANTEAYVVYIEDPAFPNPAILSTDKDKVRYGQIAVNAQIGTLQGSVSPAATIMAIYRTLPQAPLAFVPTGPVVEALKATPANVHGKSSFALRWGKTHTSLKHHVYRVLDDTLFIVDNQQRQARGTSVYENFKAEHPEFDPADVDVVAQISRQPNPKLVSRNYAGLTPRQLQILASLPDNESAFTQLTAAAIDEHDSTFEDRITEIPHPNNGPTYRPDPANILLYVDETLDGRGSNRYFYALKTLDTNGLASPLSLATLPVGCPRTTPPPAPTITAVAGGENQIVVRWAKNPGVEIAGYLLYRTQDKKKAQDWRRMELIKCNSTDNFSVEINGGLPRKEFTFIDGSVVPRQQYFYAVVAVGLSDDGKWLKSKPSSLRSGQAYELTPPEPPVWDEENSGWVYVDDNGRVYEWDADLTGVPNPQPAIQLVWLEDARIASVLVARSESGNEVGGVIVNWETGEQMNPGLRYFLDTQVDSQTTYTYRSIAFQRRTPVSQGRNSYN